VGRPLSLIAAPANAAGKPALDCRRQLPLHPRRQPCLWFPLDIVAAAKSITLDFGDRKIILLLGTNATLTNATGESVRVAIPDPEFDTDINSDGTPRQVWYGCRHGQGRVGATSERTPLALCTSGRLTTSCAQVSSQFSGAVVSHVPSHTGCRCDSRKQIARLEIVISGRADGS